MNTPVTDIGIERIARGGALHPNPLLDPRRNESGLERLRRLVAWQHFTKGGGR